MGTERWYVAVPHGCSLLERAKPNIEFSDYLCHPSLFQSGGVDWQPWDEMGEQFCAEVRALNVAHPGLKERVCTLDRTYDMLHYLLSESRRRGEFDETDWGTKAIRGAEALPDHLRGAQGHPTRYTPPGCVQEIASVISTIQAEELKPHFDLVDMDDKAVYKSFDADEDGSRWVWICELFEGFKNFYLEVARRNEGVIAIVT